jgi:hypothetical protein
MTLADAAMFSPGPPPAPGDVAPRVGVERDARADGRRRRVVLTPAGVTLERRLLGVDMRVGLPARAYRGVSLAVIVEDELPLYEVALRHDDTDLCARLTVCESREAAFAALAGWAAWFGLPSLVERPNGAFASPEQARPRGERRRRPVGRRPRFLNRRKTGRLERMAVRHLGEREIGSVE